jgi:hypothetical protein
MTIPSRFTALSLAAMLVVGLMLAASNTAFAGQGSTTRDHRDGKRPGGVAAEGGVTVNGNKKTSGVVGSTKPIGNYNKVKGPTVRDNR